MITNFEQITHDLTEEELKLVPVIITGFKLHEGRGKAIKAPEIIKRFNARQAKIGSPGNLTEARLRKICNYIRCNALLPVIATPAGYYISYDKEEIRRQIKSLQERAAAINACADGLKKFLE